MFICWTQILARGGRVMNAKGRFLGQLVVILGIGLAAACAGWIPVQRIGMPAPKLKLKQLLQAPDGTEANWVTLQGQTVVLTFFGTWSDASIEAIDHLNRVANHVRDEKVQFIAVTDESADKVETFLKRRPVLGWVGLDPGRATQKAYGVGATEVPVTYIIGPDSRVREITKPQAVSAEAVLGIPLRPHPKASR